MAQLLAKECIFDRGIAYRATVQPGILIDQGMPKEIYQMARRHAADIDAKVLDVMGDADLGAKGA
ncbi:MAG: hypothetical protein AAF566_05155 [Pseudomonadota bacterium]